MSTEEKTEDIQVNLTKPVKTEQLEYNQAKRIQFSYTWIINNWDKWHNQYKSPVFSPGCNKKLKWYLILEPSGEYCSRYLRHCIRLLPCDMSEILLYYTASLLNWKGEKVVNLKTRTVNKSVSATAETEYNFDGLFEDRVISDPANSLLQDGNLRILCDITLIVNKCFFPVGSSIIKVPECALHNDLEHLLENQNLTDVTIKIAELKLPAHKATLSARSNVFAAMFKHKMAEKQLNVVEVTDVEPEVMKELLRYIYTDRVTLIDKMADKLLMAAEKYELTRLKLMCAETLRTELTPENAADILILADLYNVDPLKTYAIDYIVSNAAEVMKTANFNAMFKSHPCIIAEILRESTSR